MTERNRAIFFGTVGALLLAIGVIGFVSATSGESDSTAAEPAAQDVSTPATPSPDVTTAETNAPTTAAAGTPTPTTPPSATTVTSETTRTSEPATTAPATTTTVAVTTTTSTTTTTTPTTTTTVALEAPEDFMNALIAAQGAADVEFLMARLHPEVFTRYGETGQCRTYLEAITFPAITLREIINPGPWDYSTDGIVTSFPEAIGVEIQRPVDGETIIQELHIVYVGPELRWFTDCGEPV